MLFYVVHRNDRLTLADRYLKVNHAGEHGAVNIYRGQIFTCRFFSRSLLDDLKEFEQHEKHHRERFRLALAERGVRRCRSYHFCGMGGLVLGLLTGLCGRSAIAATTVAVESVVLRHLEHQLMQIDGNDVQALAAIRAIVDEEQEHHDRAAVHAVRHGVWFKLLHPVVSAATQTVIWLGMRL